MLLQIFYKNTFLIIEQIYKKFEAKARKFTILYTPIR